MVGQGFTLDQLVALTDEELEETFGEVKDIVMQIRTSLRYNHHGQTLIRAKVMYEVMNYILPFHEENHDLYYNKTNPILTGSDKFGVVYWARKLQLAAAGVEPTESCLRRIEAFTIAVAGALKRPEVGSSSL
jgi:hypothetical protein